MRPKSLRTSVRPPVAPCNASRTRAQLSAEMTRLEFDRERLMRDFSMLSERMLTTRAAFNRVSKRIASIQQELDLSGPGGTDQLKLRGGR